LRAAILQETANTILGFLFENHQKKLSKTEIKIRENGPWGLADSVHDAISGTTQGQNGLSEAMEGRGIGEALAGDRIE